MGGQIVLAGLVSVVRRSGQEAVTAAARRFQLLAWPAWAALRGRVPDGSRAWHCHILPHAEREDGMFGMVTALVVQ